MEDLKPRNIIATTIFVLLVIALLVFGIPALSRYQKRAEANNEVLVNEIRIKQQEQLIEVEKQKAQIRVEEAKGIRDSQQLINATLTDQYLQHEAIQAQMNMASSPNHTQIYIPVGNNGIPLVKTVE
jgi:type II secretory pathway component PulM